MSEFISFDEWFEELKEKCKYQRFEYKLMEKNKPEWKVYYDEGYSPYDALIEDITHA